MFKKNKTIKVLLLGLTLMGVAHKADAALYNFTENGTIFATLNVEETSNTTYRFILNFNNNAGNGNFSFIDFLAIDSLPTTQPSSVTDFTTTDNVALPSILGTGTTLDANFTYDYAFDFSNSGAGRLQVGESASWTANYAGPVSFGDLGTVILNNGGQNPQDVFGVAVSAVPEPEPETYAMFLAGLGLLGFAARRRRST